MAARLRHKETGLYWTRARGFDTYEEAMEEGLKLACKIVKERRSE